jgi:hypothetical protein
MLDHAGYLAINAIFLINFVPDFSKPSTRYASSRHEVKIGALTRFWHQSESVSERLDVTFYKHKKADEPFPYFSDRRFDAASGFNSFPERMRQAPVSL